jgi:KUP system potassium uptake protein
MATIIASQAVITGAFSLTHQAIQLGYLPRLRIVHTSPTQIGQIYIPQVNWILMLATVGLVIGFHSSSQLAAAYGVAVTATMTVTSILFFAVARRRWGWRLRFLLPLVALFLAVDLAFLSANFGKIGHGAWFPLVVALAVFSVMTTWKKGRRVLAEKLYAGSPPVQDLVPEIASNPPIRVPGKAIFMAGNPRSTPPALLHNLRHNKVLHEEVAVLTIITEEVPRVARDEKVEVQILGEGFWNIRAHFGFMEEPNVPYVLALAREKGAEFDLDEVVFFIGRERIVPDRRPLMTPWREALFSFLSLNATGATRHFKLPPDRVMEIGQQVEV